jgi:hypothetical protein
VLRNPTKIGTRHSGISHRSRFKLPCAFLGCVDSTVDNSKGRVRSPSLMSPSAHTSRLLCSPPSGTTESLVNQSADAGQDWICDEFPATHGRRAIWQWRVSFLFLVKGRDVCLSGAGMGRIGIEASLSLCSPSLPCYSNYVCGPIDMT